MRSRRPEGSAGGRRVSRTRATRIRPVSRMQPNYEDSEGSEDFERAQMILRGRRTPPSYDTCDDNEQNGFLCQKSRPKSDAEGTIIHNHIYIDSRESSNHDGGRNGQHHNIHNIHNDHHSYHHRGHHHLSDNHLLNHAQSYFGSPPVFVGGKLPFWCQFGGAPDARLVRSWCDSSCRPSCPTVHPQLLSCI